ncbi:MAG: hypothetical protein IT379_33555 [Deltaproteobacteria bacterium]|nr:hypothetical protein [Deltaproteobacteria bacterium]
MARAISPTRQAFPEPICHSVHLGHRRSRTRPDRQSASDAVRRRTGPSEAPHHYDLARPHAVQLHLEIALAGDERTQFQ